MTVLSNAGVLWHAFRFVMLLFRCVFQRMEMVNIFPHFMTFHFLLELKRYVYLYICLATKFISEMIIALLVLAR